jgi:hypothetical protein
MNSSMADHPNSAGLRAANIKLAIGLGAIALSFYGLMLWVLI